MMVTLAQVLHAFSHTANTVKANNLNLEDASTTGKRLSTAPTATFNSMLQSAVEGLRMLDPAVGHKFLPQMEDKKFTDLPPEPPAAATPVDERPSRDTAAPEEGSSTTADGDAEEGGDKKRVSERAFPIPLPFRQTLTLAALLV